MLEHYHTYCRSTIVVFLDIRVVFNRIVPWNCLLETGTTEKFINILKTLHTNTLGRVRVYNHLSPLFQSSSGIRHGCPVSSSLFNFVIDGILEIALKEVYIGDVELLLRKQKRFDLRYAGNIVLLCDNTQAIQIALN